MELLYLFLGGLLSLVLCRFIKFPQKDPQVQKIQEQIEELWDTLDSKSQALPTKDSIIRHASPADVQALASIEALSYPTAEAASEESIAQRIAAFPECFWILETEQGILGFVNGMATEEKDLVDSMYSHAEKHHPQAPWQMLFSVVTAPSARGQGYAKLLMKKVIADCQARGRLGIVLTCKENLLPFYAKFGFVNEGISSSTHGNVAWYQMRLRF